MSKWNRVVKWGALGAAVGGGVLLLTGAGGTRPPVVVVLSPRPSQLDDEQRNMVRQIICACHRGGADDPKGLLVCVLRQVWADPPWEVIVNGGPVDGDHPYIAEAIAVVGGMVSDYLRLAPADRESFCTVEPDEPPPVQDDPPAPKPQVGTPPDAPPFPSLLEPNERTIATLLVGQYWEAVRTGNLASFEAKYPRQGVTSDSTWLTNTAYRVNYQSVPAPKVPENWQAKRPQWQPWVDAWLRIRGYVLQAMEETA